MLNGTASISLVRPTKSTDSAALEQIPRGTAYGEAVVSPASGDGLDVFLNEGSYFTAMPSGYVPGTGIIGPVQTTFSDTSAVLMLRNNAAISGSPIGVRVDNIKLIVTAPGTAMTSLRFVGVVDSATRWVTPGGTALTFQPAAGLGSAVSSITSGVFGALTIGAATGAKRFVNQAFARSVATVAGDTFILRPSPAASASASIGTATAIVVTLPMVPVIIPPGMVYILHTFSAAISAGITFEPVVSVIER